MAIYAVSDLHADFPENMAWIEALGTPAYGRAALIVAGDVAHDLGVVERALGALKARFSRVFYVFGNHELWMTPNEAGDSLDKLARLDELCDRLGVETRPARVDDAWVVPLRSWYDGSLAVDGAPRPADLAGWVDFRQCRWSMPQADVARHFTAANAAALRAYDGPVVSYSHFLPRSDLLPPREVLRFKGLPEVAGDAALDGQLRQLGAKVHVFGHSHINLDRVIDGVRYVQNALRYPRERQRSGQAAEPKLVWP